MAIAAVDAVITDMMFVTERHRLLQRLIHGGGSGHDAAPGEYRDTDDPEHCDDAETYEESETAGEKLGHANMPGERRRCLGICCARTSEVPSISMLCE